MALVAYSDSEGSDAEPETPAPAPAPATKKLESNPGFQVDRSNPRKIRVALPEIKSENPDSRDGDDGPARKKARLGGGGLSGFNALLPAPKRTAEKKAPVASTRKPFSLKTGAGPGFDRAADAEMRNDQAFDGPADGSAEDTIPAAGSLNATASDAPTETMKKPEEVKLQGNPMMFRPLSVGRPQKKKKTTKIAPQPTPGPAAPKSAQALTQENGDATPQPSAPPPPKPKVSLFSLSSHETLRSETASGPSTTYEPLVYNVEDEEAPPAGPAPIPEPTPIPQDYPQTGSTSNLSSLDTVANDLNLSKAERRQLFGRNGMPSQSQVRTFNTDEEYASNQVLAQTELAAMQHNPVRSIAPGGKHSLQQLVNAASSQKEALEESFAAGRRNKKEAGSRYGW